ncbi:MAG: hypothetical protein ACTHOH_18785 [Lysobacteraceae bacterium]
MRAAPTPAIRHQLRFAIALVAVSAATGWMLATRMEGLMPFVILLALANAIRPRPRASRETVSAREQAVAVAIVLVLAGLAVGGYSLDPAQTTLSRGIGAMLALTWLLVLYAYARDAAATFLDMAVPAARQAPVPTASMIRHQARFAIAGVAWCVWYAVAMLSDIPSLWSVPFLLAIWIRPAPPLPKTEWSLRRILPVLVLLVALIGVAHALHRASGSPIATWSMRVALTATWLMGLHAFARDAAATFPAHPPPTTSIELSAP